MDELIKSTGKIKDVDAETVFRTLDHITVMERGGLTIAFFDETKINSIYYYY